MSDLYADTERRALIDLIQTARTESRPDYYQPDAWLADRIITAGYAPPAEAADMEPYMSERPPEPEHLGAVVQDRNGHTYTRTHRPASVIPGGRKPWTIEIDIGTDWDYNEIPAPVKILHPGYIDVVVL